MKYNVQVSNNAEEDLDTIIEYFIYKLKAIGAANDFLSLFEQKIDNLRTSPKAYKIIDDDELRLEEIRVFQIKNYLCFYMIDEKNKIVSIIRVLYGRRDWKNILLIEEI